MVLLALLTLGMLSLSTVSLRSAGQGSANSEARANARMALIVALGELQKQMGPDQRISANGAILSETQIPHPHWTGVWDSWQAGPVDPENPTPDPESAHRTIPSNPDIANGLNPTYSTNRSSHFRSWLLSLDPADTENISSALDATLQGDREPTSDTTAVQLVGKGSLKLPTDANSNEYDLNYVSARLLPVRSGNAVTGRYGWWIGDESQKARIMDDSYESDTDDSLAARLARQQAPASTGTTTISGLEAMTTDRQLAGLPSLGSLRLADGATPEASLNFHHLSPFSFQVLSDVREGGLKRDLSTLLERSVSLSESGDEFMLYKFNEQERVPIQDLAAYYQLYHQDVGDPVAGNKGVQYSSDSLASSIQISTPDFGGGWSNRIPFDRQYTNLYRSPVPVKFQFLLGLLSKPRPPDEITTEYPSTHELSLTITLAITLWNPTNLPMVMDNRGRLFQRMRWWYLPLEIQWSKAGWTNNSNLKQIMGGNGNFAYELDLSRNEPLVFDPGEVKVLSLPYDPETSLFFVRWDGDNSDKKRLLKGWDPSGFTRLSRSATTKNQAPHIKNFRLHFNPDDDIQLTIAADGAGRQPWLIQLGQDSYHDVGIQLERSYYNYTIGSQSDDSEFSKSLMTRGFENNGPITVDIPITTLINSSASGESWPFLNFSLLAGAETREDVNASGIGGASGRKFASRPFLHSSPIRPSTIDANTAEGFYNYGWNWWIESINSPFEAPVQVTADNNGFYGGGYGPSFGTTHIVQQEIPVIPPMSIASLSHAHLGGYSLAESAPPQPWSPTLEPTPLASGRGGMFPHTLQAIGNSYAHPLLSADSAYDDNFQRTFKAGDGATSVVFADHSYLANKALWDEFFFSSITPQPASAQVFGSAGRTSQQVADEVFFGEPSKPLPNRRMTPFRSGLDESTLNDLFGMSDEFNDGLADRIAAHLMVEGPFNVNSTSVEAWKILLSSLKGKPLAYMPKENTGISLPNMTNAESVTVSGFNLPSGEPATTADTSAPSDPEQWLGARKLTDTEIEQLATAVVKQVKLRGPFLSLSEFVNRRLDPNNPDLSAKGALQAALDDDDVSINSAFRSSSRKFSASESSDVNPKFPEAFDGPVAYGSSAYVDQADILRNLAGQMTPRGDTFIIRTYGDSLDSSGQVRARAWCEAVVQRIPQYMDETDEAHIKQTELQSETNKSFGRKFEIVSFRWLNPSEI